MDMEMDRSPLRFQFYKRGGVLVTHKRTNDHIYLTATQWKWIVDNRQWAIGQGTFSLPEETSEEAPSEDDGGPEGSERITEVISESLRQMRAGKLQALSERLDERGDEPLACPPHSAASVSLLRDESGPVISLDEPIVGEVQTSGLRQSHSAGCPGCSGGGCSWI
jgi:hypothetical protein